MKSLFSPRSSASTPRQSSVADFSGWLHKRGETNRSFKSRFFVLTGKHLAYYDSDSSRDKPKGEVVLDGSTCEAVEGATTGRFQFHLIVNEKGHEGRTYIMEAADAALREKWVNTLMRAAVREARPIIFPEGVDLDQVVGPCPPNRTWRSEWAAMRMEQLRAIGASHLANRMQCASGGSESIDHWSQVRTASIEWKKSQGWDKEHAIAYTLATGCNRSALARSVRERSGQYAASLHLISRALGLRVQPTQPAPPVYYHLIGANGLATTDSTWGVLLDPNAKPGLRFVTTINALARDDPKCFPPDANASILRGVNVCMGCHEKLIAGYGGTETRYVYSLIPSPVVRFISKASSPGDLNTMTPPAHHTMVLVDGEGNRWELPALATVTLDQIDAPGTWGAFGAEKVERTLYTVSVSWSASMAPEPTAPKEGDGEAGVEGAVAALDIT